MKEPKVDRLIRKITNENTNFNLTREFTGQIMEKLGVTGRKVIAKEKPINSKWGFILTISFYIIAATSLLFIPQNLESSTGLLPEFTLPSLGEYLNLSSSFSKMILTLIVGGWLLILFDKYIKKLFLR